MDVMNYKKCSPITPTRLTQQEMWVEFNARSGCIDAMQSSVWPMQFELLAMFGRIFCVFSIRLHRCKGDTTLSLKKTKWRSFLNIMLLELSYNSVMSHSSR